MSRDDLIREAAYAIWEAEGRPDGRAEEHWRLAQENIAAGERISVTEPKPRRSAPAKGAKVAKG